NFSNVGFFNIYNPNPFPVELRFVIDNYAFAAASNEAVTPKYPGSAGLPGGTGDAGGGVATVIRHSHTEVTTADGGHSHSEKDVTVYDTSIPWPNPPLAPAVPQDPVITDNTFAASAFFGGPQVGALSTKYISGGGPDTSTDAGTTMAIAGNLRSGYGT